MTTTKTTTRKTTTKAPAKTTARKTTATKATTAKAPARKAAAPKAAPPAEAPAKTKVEFTYYIDGRPTGTVDRLSRIAFFFTKGCASDGGRIGVKTLRDLLAKAGVTDPDGGQDFTVTLPNGKVLSCKTGVTEAPGPRARKPKGETDTAAEERRAAERLSNLEVMKRAADRVKAAGRNTGPDKIVVTKDNARTLAEIPVDDLKTLVVTGQPVEAPKAPTTKAAAKALDRKTVTPRPKPTATKRAGRKVA